MMPRPGWALVALLLVPLAGGLDAATTGARVATASVVSPDSAYFAVSVFDIDADAEDGFASEVGVIIENLGTVAMTFTFELDDPEGLVTDVTPCAGATEVGEACVIVFDGPGREEGEAAFFGVVDGVSANGATLDVRLAPLTIVVRHCGEPPC